MNELITPTINKNGQQVVSARNLHKGLDVTDRFSRWAERFIIKDFIDGVDFTSVKSSTLVNNGASRELDDFALTIETAKQVAMMQHTEIGKQVRMYYVKLEEQFKINPVEQLLADPVAIGQMMIEYGQTKEHLAIAEQRIAEYEPRISYLDTILASKDTVTTSQIAADYGMSAVAMNRMLHNFRVQHKVGDQWLLYSKHMRNGYTKSETAVVKHRNGERKTVMNTKWTQKGRIFIYDLLKEQGVLPESEKMEVSA
ncbi:phage antirepressor Ant [Periweissella cryptocerci]|uniref:Phage antirepressor Ant n=1 Tax=Periweissella cryptocerci TaxID=2506420 RepID=A0A4P6YW13_9LACO|nr:phage antirepressor KilAC domain-containing protein [Periweissella cryptocerci]QBO36953.1 phage antirepressor Ant [Periweissella cryptocerci]